MKYAFLCGWLSVCLIFGSTACLAGKDYDITGTWNLTWAITAGGSGNGTGVLTCTGTLEAGTTHVADNLGHSGNGTYTVSGNNVILQLTGEVPGGSETMNGTFTSEDTISGTFTSAGGMSGTFTAAR